MARNTRTFGYQLARVNIRVQNATPGEERTVQSFSILGFPFAAVVSDLEEHLAVVFSPPTEAPPKARKRRG